MINQPNIQPTRDFYEDLILGVAEQVNEIRHDHPHAPPADTSVWWASMESLVELCTEYADEFDASRQLPAVMRWLNPDDRTLVAQVLGVIDGPAT